MSADHTEPHAGLAEPRFDHTEPHAGRAEPRFDRTEAIAMLARYGDRSPEQVDEQLGSLELTWLIAEAEQAYGIQLDLDDHHLDAIRTVDDAVAALGAQLDARTAVAP
ncbi:acyl carrier protein [Kitasatospora sp. NPDC059795]|uniref:acyl carrier protein n=1 Tax=Kitasatospora sp. NPDC059795 TaxID=3346949 RepID=UPI00365B15D8